MSIIKSYSVDKGDMFYIKTDKNLIIIDTCLPIEKQTEILKELKDISTNKEKTNFISTHADEDHIHGLEILQDHNIFKNFFCVKNQVNKEKPTISFKKYCELRDSNFAKELNDKTEIFSLRFWDLCNRLLEKPIKTIDLTCLWPNINNEYFKEELEKTKNGGSPNNISPIILHKSNNNSFMWFGDMETRFLEKIIADVNLPKVDILFAPHHGRNSGKIPKYILNILCPKIIIIGEADSSELNYYQGYNTITQNSSGDILLINDNYKVKIYVSNKNYKVNFLTNKEHEEINNFNYVGTLTK